MKHFYKILFNCFSVITLFFLVLNTTNAQTYEVVATSPITLKQVGCTNSFVVTCGDYTKANPSLGVIYTYSGGGTFNYGGTYYQPLVGTPPSCNSQSCLSATGFSGSPSAVYSTSSSVSITGASAIGGTFPYEYQFE